MATTKKERRSCYYSSMNLTYWLLLDNVGTVMNALHCYKQHVVSLTLHSCQEQHLHTKNVAWKHTIENGNNCTTKDGKIMVLKLQAKILTLSLQTLQCFTPKEENKSKSTEIINKLCKQSFSINASFLNTFVNEERKVRRKKNEGQKDVKKIR